MRKSGVKARLGAWGIGFAALAALALPAAAEEIEGNADDALPYPTGIDCFWLPSPDGYNVIDSKHLVIDGTGRNAYLATLYSSCFDLRTTFGIRFDRKGSDLCTGDAIITGDNRCVIRFLEEVDDLDHAKQIVADRKAAEKAEREEGSGNSQ